MFKLQSKYQPTGDQPKAIEQLVNGVLEGKDSQVLLGVTGSGKTFTMANVIQRLNRPTLILSHNKTLASQLYSEIKEFFPENRVEYFVSYFDYYRPEAYMPTTDVYIDKTSKTNWDLEAMRMSAMNALSMRRDTIVVASVASIYGAVNPEEYRSTFFDIELGQKIKRSDFFIALVKRNYSRNQMDLVPGSFSAKGDVIEIAPSWTSDYFIRVDFFGDEIEKISKIGTLKKEVLKSYHAYTIYPASAYTVNRDTMNKAIEAIQIELEERLKFFEKEGKLLEKQRLQERVNNDIDSLREFGFAPGIENYSRHIDGREEGQKPYTLFDFLPEDALILIDESHMMIPQLNAMYNGDRARKMNLVEYGFRLPSALDNRPLKFEEFEEMKHQKIFVSATPASYELDKTSGEVVRQIIRPTGLLDPIIEIKPSLNQIEVMYDEIQKQKEKNERTLILTTTKRTSEELSRYFQEKKEKVAYIHSEHTTFERNEILRKLRKGVFDVLIGINLLREGIDLPEVSLIMVLDADKESFFRSRSSLIQIAGRAARNDHGRVIFFADSISKSMQETIDDNLEKRKIQQEYNEKNGIIPRTVVKPIAEPIQGQALNDALLNTVAGTGKKTKKSKEELIKSLREQMKEASKELNFERAAELRDLIIELQAELD